VSPLHALILAVLAVLLAVGLTGTVIAILLLCDDMLSRWREDG